MFCLYIYICAVSFYPSLLQSYSGPPSVNSTARHVNGPWMHGKQQQLVFRSIKGSLSLLLILQQLGMHLLSPMPLYALYIVNKNNNIYCSGPARRTARVSSCGAELALSGQLPCLANYPANHRPENSFPANHRPGNLP